MIKSPPIHIKIEHTYDYDRFKLVGINRKVDKKHVQTLSGAIQNRNLLHLFPLVVNTDWEVMDGQHRLSSVKIIAQKLSLPIYYIMDPNITMDDMRILNSNKVNWKNIDYINYYVAKKNKNYIEIAKFMKAHPLVNLSAVMAIISSEKRDMKKLKEGNFVADRVDKGHFIMECVYDLRKNMLPTDQFWKSGSFIYAMKHIIDTKKYKHQVMMASEKNHRDHWIGQSTPRAYIYEMNKIYNYHAPENERVDFMRLTRDK